MKLLSQDVVMAVWWALERSPGTFAAMGTALHLSPSQAHLSMKRCAWAHLVVPATDRTNQTIVVPQRENLIEFAIHGVKYAFPAELGTITRGMPTLRGAPVFLSEFG